MKWTQTLIPTFRENPSEAEVESHRLMVRAGLIRKLFSGVYSYLPLGWRSLYKVMNIIREEMDRAGAIELYMPVLQPKELWEESGRADAFGELMCQFRDRAGRVNFLGPTHEEVITDIVRREIRSYRQLPITLYQIQTKFRDEMRPRFGVIRSREFLMKDAYSFDRDWKGLEVSYQAMYDAYCRIFSRCGLKYVVVEADPGAMGGDVSHEFMVPTDAGEDIIMSCDTCGYAANREKAESVSTLPYEPEAFKEMENVSTPGISTIEQVSRFLNIPPLRLVKTLIYTHNGKAFAVLIRGDHEVSPIKLARTFPGETIAMADAFIIENVTGAPVGFAGPVGLDVEIIADRSVVGLTNFVTGANKADMHTINVNIGRDFEVSRVMDLRYAVEGDRCVNCGNPIVGSRGIEVGHLFKLGTKYSSALGAKYLDEHGTEHLMIMGCYGIGVNRILASAIETSHDDDGVIWPMQIAPYHVHVLPVNMKNETIVSIASRLHDELISAGIEVLMDDRDVSPGVKFKDADLIGLPIRITVGKHAVTGGNVGIKRRADREEHLVSEREVVARVRKIVEE